MYDPFKDLQLRLNKQLKQVTKELIVPIVKETMLKLNIKLPLEVSIIEGANYIVEIKRAS